VQGIIKRGIAHLLGRPAPVRPPVAPAQLHASWRVIKALQEAPVAQAGLGAMQIHRRGARVLASHDLNDRIIESLVEQGVMRRNAPDEGPLAWLGDRLLQRRGTLALYQGAWTPEAVSELNARHGPLQIVTHTFVASDDPQSPGEQHQAGVLAACVRLDERCIGLLMDGDGNGTPQASCPLRVRLVDLNELLDTGLRKAHALAQTKVPQAQIARDDPTNSIWYDKSALVRKPLISPEVHAALAQAVHADSSLVEPYLSPPIIGG
jgi:hypothetical protein